MTWTLPTTDPWLRPAPPTTCPPPVRRYDEGLEARMSQIAESWDDETGQHRPLRARRAS